MDYFETLERWQELQAVIPKLQAEEKALREGLFKGTFPNPEEGVNKKELPDGRVLKGTHKLYRNVQERELPNLKLSPKLKEKLFKKKHSLVTGQYRKLDDKTRKQVDSVLIIKPGLPTLEIVEPKGDKVEVSP